MKIFTFFSFTGHVCGDYGIKFHAPGFNQTICTQGELVQGELTPNHIGSISIWMTPHSKFQGSCYLWCTENGELPSAEDDFNKIDLLPLVRQSCIIKHSFLAIFSNLSVE